MKLKPFLFSTLLSIAGLFTPAECRAQFLGYISPQTVSQKILNAVSAPATVVVPNLGQSIHAVTYQVSSPCSNSMSLDLRIEGSNDGVNFFAISEDALDQNNRNIQGSPQGGLTATGYYPVVRINLVQFVCVSGQTPTITAFYAGTSTSNPTPTATFYQGTPYRKVVLLNQPTTNAGSQTSVTVNVPSGMTGGTLWIACSNATTGVNTNCPASMTVAATPFTTFVGPLGSSGSIGAGGISYSPDSTFAVSQFSFFNVPAVSLLFTFSGAGTANVNWSIFYLENSAPALNQVPDPCASSGIAKVISFRSITTATTTTLAQTVAANQNIYVCAMQVDMTAASGTDTVQIEGGSGSGCSTPGAFTPVISTGAITNGSFYPTYGNGGATLFSQTGAQGNVSVCALTTIGTTPVIGVSITYVIQ